MLNKLFSQGGRKLWLVGMTIVFAIVNEVASLGVTKETVVACLWAAVGGSGTIALEDGLKALFGIKPTSASTGNPELSNALLQSLMSGMDEEDEEGLDEEEEPAEEENDD